MVAVPSCLIPFWTSYPPFGKCPRNRIKLRLIEFSAKAAWILVRGNRYQVLEEEFFKYVLAPHDAALLEVYGIGSADVAAGLQAIATAMREGLNSAIETVQKHMDSTYRLADEQGPRQVFPPVLQQALDLLEHSRTPGWLAVDATIRDLDDSGRADLARRFNELAGSLREFPRRWFLTCGDRVRTLLVWLFRDGAPLPHHDVVRQGELAALATDAVEAHVLCAPVTSDGRLSSAQAFTVKRPFDERADFDALRREATALKARTLSMGYDGDHVGPAVVGRNDPCWCGSGSKLKRCHGR